MSERVDLIEQPRRHPPGLRFSAADGLLLLITASATWALRNMLGELTPLIPIVVGHFFLFCNVFRIRRQLELIWAATFVVNLTAWVMNTRFGWTNVILVQTPITLALIVMEIRSKRYHGIGYRWTQAWRESERS